MTLVGYAPTIGWMRAAGLAILAILLPLLLMSIGWYVWLSPPSARAPAALPSQPNGPAATPARQINPALASQPATVPAIAASAQALEGLEEAIALWQEGLGVVQTAPAETKRPATREQAAGALVRKEYPAALAGFDRLLLHAPNDSVLLVGKALALSGLKRYEDAVPLFEHALELRPNSIAARFNLAVALMRSGQGGEAVREFETVLKADPANVRAKWNLAVIHQSAGRLQAAIARWRELTDALARLPVRVGPKEQLLDAWSHRGELAIALHLTDEAELCFRKVLELDPAQPAAWCNLGIARAAGGQRKQALDALQHALQLNPRFVPALNQAALVHAAIFADAGTANDYKKALELCERSLAIAEQPNIRGLGNTLQQIQPQSFGLHPAEASPGSGAGGSENSP